MTGEQQQNVEHQSIALTALSATKPWGPLWLGRVFYATGRVPRLTVKLRSLEFIHTARWAVIRRLADNGQTTRLRHPWLFFESNFNGGWEEYIDAFSTQLGTGMKMFWGSSYGFPGPMPTQPFKDYIRRQERGLEADHYFAGVDATTSTITRALALAGNTSGPSQMSPFMALCPIKPSEAAVLTEHLRALDPSPFDALPRTHSARFVVIEDLPNDPAQPKADHLAEPYLLFTATFDGPVSTYLDELCAQPSIQRIFEGCIGNRSHLTGYLRHNEIPPGLFYAPYGHATRQQVEAALEAHPEASGWASTVPVERLHTERLKRLLVAKQTSKRCMHPDEIGVCLATMIPLPERPEWAKHGVLERHGEIPCTLRYSTQDGIVGLAVMFDHAQFPDPVSDIICTAGRAFFFKDVEQVAEAKRLQVTRFGGVRAFVPSLNPQRIRWRAIRNLLVARRASTKIRNPLDGVLCSLVAFDHGGTILRWQIAPHPPPVGVERGKSRREALAESVAGMSVTLVLSAQVQTDTVKMPADDPTVSWPERSSPFIPVAHLVTLPGQQLLDGAGMRVELHGGQGSIGRAREVIYPALQEIRLGKAGDESD